MVGRDVAPLCKGKVALQPKAYTTTATGVTINLKGYDGCVFFVQAGVIGAGAPCCAFTIKDSPNGSAWTDVDDKYLTGVETDLNLVTADVDKAKRLGYKGPQQYVRLDLTTCGASSLLAAMAVLTKAGDVPVTQD